MRATIAAILAGAILAFCGAESAWAQGIDSGSEVRVNPVSGSSGVLLYPGGQYMRRVPVLLAPGEKPGPVQLHMPRKGVRRAAADTSVVAAKPRPKREVVASAAPSVAPAAAPPASAPPASSPSAGGGIFYGLGANSPTSIYGAAPSPARAAKPAAKPAPKTQIAKVEGLPDVTTTTGTGAAPPATPGLSKRSVILFAPKASDPAESAMSAITFLAGDLTKAMTSAASRVQLLAYGGTRGDKGSEARRLSLKRALSIRQMLIDGGVSPDRIDVRAMGGVDDSGPADRVDVYVKA